MIDLFASLLGIVASALAEHQGLLAAGTLIALAWLARTVALRLSDRTGVGMGTLLVVALILAWLCLKLGQPPGPSAGEQRAARRLQELRRSNAEAEEMLNRMMRQGW